MADSQAPGRKNGPTPARMKRKSDSSPPAHDIEARRQALQAAQASAARTAAERGMQRIFAESAFRADEQTLDRLARHAAAIPERRDKVRAASMPWLTAQRGVFGLILSVTLIGAAMFLFLDRPAAPTGVATSGPALSKPDQSEVSDQQEDAWYASSAAATDGTAIGDPEDLLGFGMVVAFEEDEFEEDEVDDPLLLAAAYDEMLSEM